MDSLAVSSITPYNYDQIFVDVLIACVTGILTGLLSSYIFLMYFLKYKKPVIEISDHISKLSNPAQTNGWIYTFKIVNKTDCSIYSVGVDACFMTPEGSDGGQNLVVEKIPVQYDNYSHIPKKHKNDTHACHAVRIQCFENIESKWAKERFLRLEIFAKHELSGFSKIFVKDFHNTRSIKAGEFRFGDELTIS